MPFPRRTIWTSVAIVATLMIGVPGAADAQGPPRQRFMAKYHFIPYTPAAGAKDLKSVLFNWAWYTGMLRTDEERDLVMTLDYQGKGTMQVDGQPCNVTLYRADFSYRASGERIRVTGTRPDGQSCSNIQVLSGAYGCAVSFSSAEFPEGGLGMRCRIRKHRDRSRS